jgi:transcriptional regulator with XRE-family HTH domain
VSEPSAEEQLRTQVRGALADAKISQAEIARQLGLSTKHLSMMLTGKAPLSLTWAEGILGLAGHSLVIGTRPDDPALEEVIRSARLDSLGVLLTRVANGVTLTSDEARLLVDHIDVEVRESTTAREMARAAARRTT